MKNFTILVFVLSCIFLKAVEEESVIIGKKFTIHSELLQEDREFLFYLPGDYDTSDDHYPLLIDIQGSELLFHKETGTVRYLSEFSDDIPQMIVVNILFTDYRRDVFPRKLKRIPGTGGSDKFLDFIQQEMLPYLQENYRLTDHYTIYGQSNTGMFSLYALLSRPELFAACIASSPAVGQGDSFIYGITDSLLQSGEFSQNKIFITHALDDPLNRIVGDALPGYLNIMKATAPQKLTWKYEEYETGGHCPQISLHNGLLWLFSDWQIPEETKTESVEAVISYADDLQEKYGLRPEIASVLQETGLALISSEQYDKAIDYMIKLTELRPEELLYHYQIGKIAALSGNNLEAGINSLELYINSGREELNPSRSAACWRLGMIYEKMGESDKARSSYEKGLELDPADRYCKAALMELEDNE
jgi:tetratricopeptide (TPR) repeat protein